MKKKNGFTLIELLAIIVILAIIAVITVPIILNIIENSKMGAAKDSAYGYKDSVNKWYVSKLTEDPNYVLNDGTYSVSELGATVEGKQPGSNSWVTISKTNVTDGCLQFDEYKVEITNGNVGEASVGECSSIAELLDGNIADDGAKYLTIAQVVYYNPGSATEAARKCTQEEYVSENSTPGAVSGCMKWYLYSVKGNYANMMLDHNITIAGAENGVWASSEDYSAGLTALGSGGYAVGEGIGSKAISAGISYPDSVTSFLNYGDGNDDDSGRGPVTALNTLKNITANWQTGTPKVPNSSNANEHIIPSSANYDKYQISYEGYRARLITQEETEYLGCKTNPNNSCPAWMNSATEEEDSIKYENITGYWTSTANRYGNVWYVIYDRWLYISSADNINIGVRPVITVSTSDIF